MFDLSHEAIRKKYLHINLVDFCRGYQAQMLTNHRKAMIYNVFFMKVITSTLHKVVVM